MTENFIICEDNEPVIITITPCKGKGDKTHKETEHHPKTPESPHHKQAVTETQQVPEDLDEVVLYRNQRTSDISQINQIATQTHPQKTGVSFPDNQNKVLPKLPPRYHGSGCAMEVGILEKHTKDCGFKKLPNEERNPIDDKSGSYECIGRLSFRICGQKELVKVKTMDEAHDDKPVMFPEIEPTIDETSRNSELSVATVSSEPLLVEEEVQESTEKNVQTEDNKSVNKEQVMFEEPLKSPEVHDEKKDKKKKKNQKQASKIVLDPNAKRVLNQSSTAVVQMPLDVATEAKIEEPQEVVSPNRRFTISYQIAYCTVQYNEPKHGHKKLHQQYKKFVLNRNSYKSPKDIQRIINYENDEVKMEKLKQRLKNFFLACLSNND